MSDLPDYMIGLIAAAGSFVGAILAARVRLDFLTQEVKRAFKWLSDHEHRIRQIEINKGKH